MFYFNYNSTNNFSIFTNTEEEEDVLKTVSQVFIPVTKSEDNVTLKLKLFVLFSEEQVTDGNLIFSKNYVTEI